ncbi:MAG TPA: cupin domain-containing protein [Candidatus Limnocylindria bacterium]|nr:cupin domain-containing protein [Candidatus Limnocylindria bacterium]
MIVRKVTEAGRAPRSGELFVGAHDYQLVLGSTDSSQFSIAELTFRDGARTKPHVHGSEQVIVVMSGRGLIGTRDAEQEIGVGDVVLLGRDEAHWHGVREGGDVTFWSILGPHKTRLA